MPLPLSFLESLAGLPGFDRAAFEQVHASDVAITSLRLNGAKMHINASLDDLRNHWKAYPLQLESPVPWCNAGWYLASRPSFTFDPLFHAGCYYVQEASSMFLEQALMQLADTRTPLRILDLSAAPGGKSTHIQSLISKDSLLVSNEVIKSRSHILRDNMIRWGGSNVIVTQNDPSVFPKLGGYFDVIVVDAPCSGSGMFRKDPDAISEWSPAHVGLCSGRQQRILADVLPALKSGGLLVYSTCSYSVEEDEDISDWLVSQMGLSACRLQIQNEWNIVETFSSKKGAPGYRFYPDKVKGEGFFLSCFIKGDGDGLQKIKPLRPEKASAAERAALPSWVEAGDLEIMRDEAGLYAVPAHVAEALSILQGSLHVVYKGISLGQVMKGRLVPDHALALSGILSRDVPSHELTYAEAIKYLQRGELSLQPAVKGWQVVTFQNHALGWINALPARINNYYPKEMRILKQWPGP